MNKLKKALFVFLLGVLAAVLFIGCGPAIYIAGAGAGGYALAKQHKSRRYHVVTKDAPLNPQFLPAVGSLILITVSDDGEGEEDLIGVVIRYEEDALILLVEDEEIVIVFRDILSFSSFEREDDKDQDKDCQGRHRGRHCGDKDKDKDD